MGSLLVWKLIFHCSWFGTVVFSLGAAVVIFAILYGEVMGSQSTPSAQDKGATDTAESAGPSTPPAVSTTVCMGGSVSEPVGMNRSIGTPEADRLLSEAVSLLEAGDVWGAARLAQRAVQEAPQCSRAYYYLGTAMLHMGRVDNAVAALERAVEIDSTSHIPLVNLGLAYHGAGRYQDAERALRRAIALSPGHPTALNNLGLALAGQGRHQEAIAAYKQALLAGRGDATTCFNLACSLASVGDHAAARREMERALALDPGNVKYRQFYGDLLGR
jgi:Flp pilus assembly protein TadD